MSKNLTLWNAVVTTDPNYTKSFTRGGGFKGTATNFVYLARKATEQFGPCGIGWGAMVIDEKYVEGAPIGDGVREITHVVRIEFWYVPPSAAVSPSGVKERGSIEAYGQTTYVGKNSRGFFTDEEAPKKSLTDAMSKAMSWLGFGADIHLGLYDDNKYVSDLREEFGHGKEAIVEEPLDVEAMVKEVMSAETLDALRDVKVKCREKVGNNAGAWLVVSGKIKERLAQLQEKSGATKKG